MRVMAVVGNVVGSHLFCSERAASMNQTVEAFRFSLREARRKVEEKDRRLVSKLMSIEEVVRRFIADGQSIAIGGCLYSRTPMAVVHEIIRQKRRGLTASRNLASFEADLLAVAGCINRIQTSWYSTGYAWGISRIMREYVEGGKISFEEWSHVSLGLRFRAAAMGIPFLPTLSMLGSDLQKKLRLAEAECPYTGERLCLIPALFPDVGIIHAHRADEYGNVQIDGYPFMDYDIARAASRVIVTAEEIIDTETLRREPARTLIPFFCVDAVVEVPFGAYPSECYGLYEADFEHLGEYADTANREGPEGVKKYIEKYITGVASFSAFLNLIGAERILRRRREMSRVLA